MHKALLLLLSFAMSLAIMSPVKKEWRGVANDSFPLSWFPMFSKPRKEFETIAYMVGILPDGTRRVIPSRHFVQGGMNQARRHVWKYAKYRAKSMQLCQKAAARMGRYNRGSKSRMVQVQLLRGKFSREEFFRDRQPLPVSDQVRAACHVPGRDQLPLPKRGAVLTYDKEKAAGRR